MSCVAAGIKDRGILVGVLETGLEAAINMAVVSVVVVSVVVAGVVVVSVVVVCAGIEDRDNSVPSGTAGDRS